MTQPTPSGRERTIWDGATQTFDVGLLRQAMMVRNLAAETLADAADVSRGTVYGVLAGRRPRLTTARRILEALASVEPTLSLRALAPD